MPLCRTQLKYGKRKGQECGCKAKYKHMGVSLCGIHFRPYKKLQETPVGSPPGIGRLVEPGGLVKHVLKSPIYPNQSKASREIVEHFKAGRHAVFLAAEMQAGKSGTAKDTIVRFQEEFPDSVASVILTINDNDIAKQMQREFGPYIPYNYIFKATDLCSKLYLKTLQETHRGKKILIIIDESHYGNSRDGSLDRFFKSGDIGLDGCNLPDNMYLLTISATGNAEVVLTGQPDINQYKRVVVLENGEGYYGIGNMLEDGSLQEGWKLVGHDIEHESWQKLKTTIDQFCTGPPKYKVIRVNCGNGIKALRRLVPHLKFISYDQNSTVRDINTIVGQAPEQHTVIALAQKIKASKQLDTTHTNMMFEYCTTNMSTSVQGLPGRRSGYGKSGHDVTIFSNMKHCKVYNSWAKNGFRPEGTPNDNHVTHGVCGYSTEEWERNVPLHIDLGGQVLKSAYHAILNQLRPLIQAQYPEIYAEYPVPLSGTGILKIKEDSKPSTKKLWWDNIIEASELGTRRIGYPRSVNCITAQKGFFLFVNTMENKVMMTYTKKGLPSANPVVASTCAFRPL